MDAVIYFIEDQEALTPYILVARSEDRFPGCKILAADSIDDAIEWCPKSDAEVLFVVDSRMTSELLPEHLQKVLENSEVKMEDLSDLLTDEVLTGALGTAVLRYLKPKCRIILVTAFHRRISGIRRTHPALDKLLREAIDVSLPKKDPEALTEAIQMQLIKLSRAHSPRQTD